MRISRRRFVQTSAMVGAGLYLWRGKLFAFSQSPALRKFIEPLPGLDFTGTASSGLPVAAANTSIYPGVDFYTIRMGAYTQQFHPDLPGPSHLWGYADITDNKAPNHRYLGGVIVAKRGTPVRVDFVNQLPDRHPLSIDKSLPGCGLIPGTNKYFSEGRAAVHLHGGFVPWTSDGGPFHWFDAQGNEGLSRLGWLPVGRNDPRFGAGKVNSKDYWYPNAQSARLLWYHDHAVGITRLNAYAGLATAYLLLDAAETQLMAAGAIPGIDRVVPLVVQDKTFIGPGGNPDGGRGGPGDLWYPNLYEKNGAVINDIQTNPSGRWDWGGDVFPGSFQQPPNPSCVPEFFSDTPIVNGMAYPYVDLEPRRYRFLFLNGSQARFYNMQLYFAQSNDLRNPLSGEADLKHASKGIPAFVQIANEGGFLPAPVIFPNNPPAQIGFDQDLDPTEGNATRYNLLLAPAERADVIVDFSGVKPGSVLILYNDAPAPFPGGDPRNDYFTGDPDYSDASANADGLAGGAPTTQLGHGPNLRTLMQFRIKPLKGAADAPFSMPVLPPLDPEPVLPLRLGEVPAWVSDPNLVANVPSGVDIVRDLTLNEYFDEFGRLIQLLGTTVKTGDALDGTRLYGQAFTDPTTLLPGDGYQNPKVGAVEVWRIFNTTGDVHPMHFHLVNVQVISRQAYKVDRFLESGEVEFLNWPADPAAGRLPSPRPPDPNELGWKETVRMNPGECITVAMRFVLPPDPVVEGKTVKVPFSPRFLVMGVKGYEYVWHCHILEHEEHDMMHSLLVRP